MPIASTTAKIQTAIAVERVKEVGCAAALRVGGEPFIDASSVGMVLLIRVLPWMRGTEAAIRSVATHRYGSSAGVVVNLDPSAARIPIDAHERQFDPYCHYH